MERRQKAVAAKDSLEYAQNQGLLRTYYPNIAADSAADVLDHGFLKGSGRVGRAKALDEQLRVTLAVNAHIRHRLTDYDSLLSRLVASGQDHDAKRMARETVDDQVSGIADSWRADGGASVLASLNTAMKRTYISTTSKAAATLEKNRSRRKNKAQGKALEKALEGLGLDEGSGPKLGAKQQRKAAIREDLKRLKLDPTHKLKDKHLAEVLELHRKNGDDIKSLGSVVQAQAAELRARNDNHNTKRATLADIHEGEKASPAACEIPTMSKEDQALLSQFERNPSMSLKKKTRSRITRLLDERKRFGARGIRNTALRQRSDGSLTYVVETEEELENIDPAKSEEGHSRLHTNPKPKSGLKSPSISKGYFRRAEQIDHGSLVQPATQSNEYHAAIVESTKEEIGLGEKPLILDCQRKILNGWTSPDGETD